MKPPKHTIQWIAPHLSENEVKAIYEMVLDVIGADEQPDPGSTWGGRHTQNKLKEAQRSRLAKLFGMDNK